MTDGLSPFSRYFTLWVRIFFGAHLLYSALRYFLGFEVVGPTDSIGGGFVTAITNMGLYHAVKTIELITGLMFLFNILVPLALVIEMPITVIIFYLNTIIEGTGWQLFSGPQELVTNVVLMVCYARYYMPLLTVFAPARPLWNATRADIRIP